MKCDRVRPHLSAYLDGVIGRSDRRQVEEHLAECAGCRALTEELGRNIKQCRSLPELAPPPGFRQKVERAVQDAAADPPEAVRLRLGRWWGDLRWKRAAVAVAGAALLFVVAGIALDERVPWPTAPGQLLVIDAVGEEGEARLVAPADAQEPAADQRRRAPVPPATEAAGAQTAGQLTLMPRDRKIIQNADLEVAVTDFRRSFQEIVGLTEAAGGFVESSNFWQGEGESRGGSLRLRVPQDRFIDLLTRIEEQGQVLQKSIHGQDVTQAYVDIDARLRALRVQEERLLLILGRANTVGEVLQVEAERTRVRAEIESLTATLQQYDRLVSFSTIAVNLVPPREVPPPPAGDLWGRLRAAFLRSLRWLAYLGEQALLGLFALAPVIVLGGATYLGVRGYLRRRRA
ncbi:MAG TPA: DUF4349 domain-containing protein [Bacillota bacterium]|nr:DUF4349 domain-containing protein [Bacillota bacterium]